jgi:hypothetical protein
VHMTRAHGWGSEFGSGTSGSRTPVSIRGPFTGTCGGRMVCPGR